MFSKKNLILMALLTIILFSAGAQQYKICLSSVLKEESARYLSEGFQNDGIRTVYEIAQVRGQTFIRILTADTWGDFNTAVRVKNNLAATPFISAHGIRDLWIRPYSRTEKLPSAAVPLTAGQKQEPPPQAVTAPPAEQIPPAAEDKSAEETYTAEIPVESPPAEDTEEEFLPESAENAEKKESLPESTVATEEEIPVEAEEVISVEAEGSEQEDTSVSSELPSLRPAPPAPEQLNISTVKGDDLSAKPDDVFNRHKDLLNEAYNFIQEFVDTRDSDEAQKLAESIPLYLQAAQIILPEWKTYLPQPLSSYEKENEEAKALRLASKVSFLETKYLERAQKKLIEIRGDLIRAIEGDLNWLSSPYANIIYAPAALERIRENFYRLDKIVPKDPEIAELKEEIWPQAIKEYQRIGMEISSNTMPYSGYQGEDQKALEETIFQLTQAQYPDREILKTVIVSEEWEEKALAELKDGKIEAGIYRDITAAVALDSPAGEDKATVYFLTFRKQWTGEGEEFGALELHAVGENYLMLRDKL